MEGVEFELLDENKNVIYNDLKTNNNGEIQVNNLIPGIYYLRETNTKDGYSKYEELIKISIKLNEQVVVTVNNKKEDKPTIETSEKKLEVNQEIVKEKNEKQTNIIQENIKQVKTLPVTGM